MDPEGSRTTFSVLRIAEQGMSLSQNVLVRNLKLNKKGKEETHSR